MSELHDAVSVAADVLGGFDPMSKTIVALTAELVRRRLGEKYKGLIRLAVTDSVPVSVGIVFVEEGSLGPKHTPPTLAGHPNVWALHLETNSEQLTKWMDEMLAKVIDYRRGRRALDPSAKMFPFR